MRLITFAMSASSTIHEPSRPLMVGPFARAVTLRRACRSYTKQ